MAPSPTGRTLRKTAPPTTNASLPETETAGPPFGSGTSSNLGTPEERPAVISETRALTAEYGSMVMVKWSLAVRSSLSVAE